MKGKMILGYGNTANYITLSGLLLALASCYFAINANLKLSMTLLIVSGLCDLFDGFAARRIERTDEEKRFGIHLDTACDVASFGVAPAVITYATCGDTWYVLVVCSLYVMCAVVRLAYFSAGASPEAPASHYSGLPVTYIALILPIVLLTKSSPVCVITLAVTAVFFVLNIKMPKPRGAWYVLFPVIAAVLVFIWWFAS